MIHTSPRPAWDSDSRRDPGASLLRRAKQYREPPLTPGSHENPQRNPAAWCQGSHLGCLCREMTAKGPSAPSAPRCSVSPHAPSVGRREIGEAGPALHVRSSSDGHKGSARVESCLRRLRGGIVEPYCGG